MSVMRLGPTAKLFVRLNPHTQGHVKVTWSDCLIGVCECGENPIIAQMSDSQSVVMTEAEGQAMVAWEQAFLASHPSVMAHMQLFQNADTAWDGIDLMETALERMKLMEATLEMMELTLEAMLLMALYSFRYGTHENRPVSPHDYGHGRDPLFDNMPPDEEFEFWVFTRR